MHQMNVGSAHLPPSTTPNPVPSPSTHDAIPAGQPPTPDAQPPESIIGCNSRGLPNNAAWILAQAPEASRVASYRTWQQVGRQVRKGETGIMVFHPKPYWVDPTSGDRVRPPRTAADRARPH